jgi:hypothetical protein
MIKKDCSGLKLSGPIKGLVLCESPEELKLQAEALDWYLLAWNMDQFLRTQIKHGQVGVRNEKNLQAVRDVLCRLMAERNLSFHLP